MTHSPTLYLERADGFARPIASRHAHHAALAPAPRHQAARVLRAVPRSGLHAGFSLYPHT